jgi:hypothetical protein
VAINPGTVLANAIRLFDRPLLYDYHVSRENGLVVHAPGGIDGIFEERGNITFVAEGWADHPYYMLIAGLRTEPRVHINGDEIALAAPHVFDAEAGRLILRIDGVAKITVSP